MSYNVIRPHAPFERLKSYEKSPEVGLHKSIILQAIIDATHFNPSCTSKENSLIASEARNWLLGASEDFKTICFRANMEPSFVRRVAVSMIELHKEKQKANLSNSKSIVTKSANVQNTRSSITKSSVVRALGARSIADRVASAREILQNRKAVVNNVSKSNKKVLELS